MRRAAWLPVCALLLCLGPGCLGRRLNALRETSGELMRCEPSALTLEERPKSWHVVGCDQQTDCDSVDREWQCSAPRPTNERRALDRLSLETGCSLDRIKIVSRTTGIEEGFRLAACDSTYVCMATPERVECRQALEETLPPVPRTTVIR